MCGKSGSGKTTLIKLVNGLIPYFDTGKKTGVVLIEGEDTETIPMYKISLKVGSIFQDPKSQFFNIDTAVFIERGKIKSIYSAEQFFALLEHQRKTMGLRRLNPYSEVSIQPSIGRSSQQSVYSLELENVEIAFGKNTILENISFSLQSGDIAAVVGTNGVGKTTLCRTICGFLESKQGKILMDGVVVKKRQRLRKSYIVMQDTNYQLFAESVLDECLLENPLVSESKVKEVLERLDLSDVLENHPQSLSGGQKQRLAILADKEIVIFDEPTSGLEYSGDFLIPLVQR